MDSRKYILWILILSALTHFVFWGYPKETVFDEVHFGKFISGYFTHEYFFDIHPPLGKLIIAGVAKLSKFKPGFSFQNIGQKYQDNQYKVLRFIPSLFGTFLPLILFYIFKRLGIEEKKAFLGSLFVVFENALIVQSRFILLDSMLLFFGFLSILFFLKKNILGAGISGVLAASIKWTGLSFLGLIIIWQTFKFVKKPDKKLFLKNFAFLFLIPLTIYFLIFLTHFSLLTKTGPGDGFHSPAFQKTLILSKYYDQEIEGKNIFEKFIELNNEIYRANKNLNASHPYSSKYYTWPLMAKLIFYWNGSTAKDISQKIYLLGNPVIWWFSTIAVLYMIYGVLKREKANKIEVFLIAGYLINILPFIKIGRVMFLYHYLPALVFSIMILVYILQTEQKTKLLKYLLIAAIFSFTFFSPLTYGFQIPNTYYDATVWLPGWR